MATQSKKPHLAALTVAIPPQAGGAVQIFPAGQFDAPRGSLLGTGPWRLDAQSAAALIDRVGALSNDILVDYDHQSIDPDAQPPILAAGWLSRDGFEWREGQGFFHRAPQWTAACAQHIEAGEIRYVSAVFPYDPATGTVLDIVSVAVTNQPGLDGMQPLVAALSARLVDSQTIINPEAPMDELLEQLRWMLSLPLSSGAPEVLAELQKLIDKIKSDGEVAATGRASLLAYIGALSARAATQPDPAKFVPVEVVRELQADVAALRREQTTGEARALIESALAACRIATPAKRAYAHSLAGLDADGNPVAGATPNLAALRAYLESEEPVAALAGTQTGGQPPADSQADQPSGTALAVCKLMGLKPERYAAGAADLKSRFPGVYR